MRSILYMKTRSCTPKAKPRMGEIEKLELEKFKNIQEPSMEKRIFQNTANVWYI